MIDIVDKHSCCGCGACVQACPQKCISFTEDEEGFNYPKVNKDICVNCKLCEKVCPFLNQHNPQKPIKAYASINTDQFLRSQSSSGGVFTEIANNVINRGGVVFGARFNNNWEVIHDYTDTIDGLSSFRGSKYVQSNINNSFTLIRGFLTNGKWVLFSGTPCQVAGLLRFLNKEYEKLITVEVACHGVPSPKLWRDYLRSISKRPIGSISMKEKSTGWTSYSIIIRDTKGKTLLFEKASNNAFLNAFIKNYSLRPSCYNCPAKAGKSRADITLADFWKIEELYTEFNDNKGTSFVCINTRKGESFYNGLTLNNKEADYEKGVLYNPCIESSVVENQYRADFFYRYSKEGIKVLNTINKRSLIRRFIMRFLK